MSARHTDRGETIGDRCQQAGTLPDIDPGLTGGDYLPVMLGDGRGSHDKIGLHRHVGSMTDPGIGACSVQRRQHRARLEIGPGDLVTALDIADPESAVVPMDMPLSNLLEVFTSHHVAVLTVVESQGSRHIVGLVEQRDLLRTLRLMDRESTAKE